MIGSLIGESLLKAKLLDEFRLILCPVVLGVGGKLFDDAAGSIRETPKASPLDARGRVAALWNCPMGFG